MILTMLPPLIWALAGLVAVMLLSDHRASGPHDAPRIDVIGDDLRPAA